MQYDPTRMSAKDIYQLMIRTIVPRPIAWISTVSGKGEPNVAPFSFFAGITADPPALCFSPARRSGGEKKDTLANVESTGEFVVNVVTEDWSVAMNETATDFPAGVNEFERAGLTPVPGAVVVAPRIGESPVQMECKLLSLVPVGEKGGMLVIGEVVMFHIDGRVVADGRVDAGLLRAVGRMGGQEYTRTNDRFVLERKKFGKDVF
ncbi:MAG: flavin reductase family protein [Candidatus Latescibacterota bacterium]|jgi:flavin reductase (DIM6/NTAB) family NADH-FMN oxidoreductase RutF